MYRHELWIRLVASMAFASLVLALLAHVYIGSFSRYMADDYCTSSILRSHGLIDAQTYWYENWSGRFSFTVAVSVAELVGPRLVPFLPTIATSAWLAALTWTLFQLSRTIGLSQPLTVSLLLSGLLIFACLDSAPNIAQSLYWQTGMLTYAAPLILGTIYAGLVCHSLQRMSLVRPSLGALVAGASLTFIAGGFSEVYAAMQTGGLFLAIVICWIWAPRSSKRTALLLLITSFLGSLLAVSALTLSPGTQLRQAHFPPPPGLSLLITRSVIYAIGYIVLSVTRSPLTAALSFVLPAIIAFKLHPQQKQPKAHRKSGFGELARVLLLSAVAGFALIAFCFAPAVYATSATLPARARIIPQFVLVCVMVCWGYLAGLILRQTGSLAERERLLRLTAASILVIALLMLSPIASVQRTLALEPMARAYASMWDSRDNEILNSKLRGFASLAVPVMDNIAGLEEIGPDPSHWVNGCVAEYYGLDAIMASSRDEVIPLGQPEGETDSLSGHTYTAAKTGRSGLRVFARELPCPFSSRHEAFDIAPPCAYNELMAASSTACVDCRLASAGRDP